MVAEKEETKITRKEKIAETGVSRIGVQSS
jgi:hypothetical protein